MQATDGNEAAAHVAYGMSEFCFIFPITPSSPMAERADFWMGQKRPNVFGDVTTVYQMQSEAGAVAALHGCGAAGGLGATFTSSQGLLLMIPTLYKLSGERIPCVLHVAARQVGSSGTSIYCDHSDVMSVRMCGLCQLSSGSVQEAMDLAAVAHAAAVRMSMPFMHFFDGFQSSHSVATCDPIPYDKLRTLYDAADLKAFRATALDPAHPHQRGTITTRHDWMQMFESVTDAYERGVPAAVEDAMARVAALTGRRYHLFDYAGAPDAECVVVALGAGALTVEEVVDDLVRDEGAKVGVLRVHLYRPWSARHFVAALPRTVRRIAVLDRTKEPGSIGEPLLLDVLATVHGAEAAAAGLRGSDITVVGGRYGLADKAFTPLMVRSIFASLADPARPPMPRFVVGIDDDVAHLSLPLLPRCPEAAAPGLTQCTLWGLGSDGTVGAAQMALRLATGHSTREKPVYTQGQFHFTAHKSGGVTITYMRFGPSPIKGSYPITHANFTGCYHPSYVGKYPVLDACRKGSVLLLNCPWGSDAARGSTLARRLPAAWRRRIAEQELQFYTIDAMKISRAAGLGQHYNLVLLTAFFKLSGVLPVEEAIPLLKDSTRRQYAKKGDAVIQKNISCIDAALAELHRVDYPRDEWLHATDDDDGADANDAAKKVPEQHYEDPQLNAEFERDIKTELARFTGDRIPVSKFAKLIPAGRAPSTTTRTEKRGVAVDVPVWDPAKCVECNMCALACPHAVIRPFLMTDDEVRAAPCQPLPHKAANGEGGKQGLQFHLQVSALDCLGCGVCAAICPAKCLTMRPLEEVAPTEAANWQYCFNTVPARNSVYAPETARGSQFTQPLFEFCGACGGCGEAPYIKLLTQLFGERMIAACASGCNVAYSFALGSNPYCTTPEGRGPASAHSLFEDTAEFGFGIARTRRVRREAFGARVRAALEGPADADAEAVVPAALATELRAWLDVFDDARACEAVRRRIEPLLAAAAGRSAALQALHDERELLTKTSLWCIGGDGWSCDIDFGGIDHVLYTGEKLNMLVLDTEVYSNTGGQKSKGTPMGSVHKFEAAGKASRKKDLGQIFMNMGTVYVASVCLYANAPQTLKALLEAEAYPGPAVVLAYSPCLEHGIEGSGPNWVAQAKLAVDSGYWPLYRYNPLLAKDGKNPLQIDGPRSPKVPVADFIAHENRFQRLVRENNPRSVVLHKQLQDDVTARLEKLVAAASVEPPKKE